MMEVEYQMLGYTCICNQSGDWTDHEGEMLMVLSDGHVGLLRGVLPGHEEWV
jgi:hypothetical protein